MTLKSHHALQSQLVNEAIEEDDAPAPVKVQKAAPKSTPKVEDPAEDDDAEDILASIRNRRANKV